MSDVSFFFLTAATKHRNSTQTKGEATVWTVVFDENVQNANITETAKVTFPQVWSMLC